MSTARESSGFVILTAMCWRSRKRGRLKSNLMNAEDFREMALSFDGAEEGSHMGASDFRVGGRIFATLAMQHLGFGNLMLSPDLQKALIAEAPDVFLPIPGGWGRMGCTHVRLAKASPQQMLKGLQDAWSFRIDKNTRSRSSRPRKGRAKP